MKRVEVPSYPVSIFIATDDSDTFFAEALCRKYCNDVGFCVTVTRTFFAYRNGKDHGVIVGLINYPPLPAKPAEIFAKAEALALLLIDGLGQQSCSIQAPDKTVWISFRDIDNPD